MEIVAAVIEAVMGVMSAWLVVMLLYQLCISFFGFKRNTKNYQDHDPQMRFLVLVPAHNEEAVIADIIDNLERLTPWPDIRIITTWSCSLTPTT